MLKQLGSSLLSVYEGLLIAPSNEECGLANEGFIRGELARVLGGDID